MRSEVVHGRNLNDFDQDKIGSWFAAWCEEWKVCLQGSDQEKMLGHLRDKIPHKLTIAECKRAAWEALVKLGYVQGKMPSEFNPEED